MLAPIAAFLEPGCGFGGSCLPKDVAALVAHGADRGIEMPVLRSVLEVNRGQPAEVLRLLRKRIPDIAGLRVVVLGLTFKPDTDDLRESPAFPVIKLLLDAGAIVDAYDPLVKESNHPGLGGVQLHNSMDAALAVAQAVILVTRWPEFSELAARIGSAGTDPVVIDGRRMLNPSDFDHYEGIGR